MRIRNQNEIILRTIDFLRTAQPKLDTKAGTVARDLVVDGPAAQLAMLYEELARVANLQSLKLSLGSDLDKLAQNFGMFRKPATKASGIVLYTFNSIFSDFAINKGEIVTANNGATFIVVSSQVVSPIYINTYRATASKYRADLDFAGIQDQYAVEVRVEATSAGVSGNISKYSISSFTNQYISNVTNAVPFGGGQAAESDSEFRDRVLASFSGSNTGTALGYRSAVLADPAVIDAVVIEPGNPLMTRDGTVVRTSEDGSMDILSEGSGGKVDVLVYGFRLQEVLDSYIYRDLSNRNDPTDPVNDFVLGQIIDDAGKSVSRKRIDNIETGILPSQPVNNIIQVTGSSSGSNFIPKSTDAFGRVSGNYELVRDNGSFGGSPWGFDRLRWISDRVSGYEEDKTKSKFNSQDKLLFSDVLKISGARQNIQIINENGKVNPSDRSLIQLSHTPITNVTRVVNITTGERYVVENQNPQGVGLVNNTGVIKINGSSLPSVSDILQIDYTWIMSFDDNFDFDNKISKNNIRSSSDSIDWGYSNIVRREQSVINVGSALTVSTIHPVSSVSSVNTFESEVVTLSATGSTGRLFATLSKSIKNIDRIVRVSDSAELYNTKKGDGTFTAYNVYLPTDTVANINDEVEVVFNLNNVFMKDGVSGSFSGNTITLPEGTDTSAIFVECNYISDINVLLPPTILSSLPAKRFNNQFKIGATSPVITGYQPTTHSIDGSGTIHQNFRMAPTRLGVTISGNISPGVINISGTTFGKIHNEVITVSSDGLKQNLSSAIRKFLKLDSNKVIPNNISIAKLVKFEKVTTAPGTSSEVLSVDHEYDIKGYKLSNNDFDKDNSILDSSLNSNEISLPSTSDNIKNALKIGDKVRVTFYIKEKNANETIFFSKAGTLYTDKIFSIIDLISVSSGFTSGLSTATISITNLNQPVSGTRYSAIYDYKAPKKNERITIRYYHNKLINDSTLQIENVRPISADVLVKAAKPILVNATINIVLSQSYDASANTVKQNVKDAVSSIVNASALGSTLDSSDLINACYTVQGVDRARVILFNKNDKPGSVLSIKARQNEYIVANNIIINVENR